MFFKLKFFNGKTIEKIQSIEFWTNDIVFINNEYQVNINHVLEPVFIHNTEEELYEGDIVTVRKIDNIYGAKDQFLTVVAYNYPKENNISTIFNGGGDGSIEFEDIKKIGNIFENPELKSSLDIDNLYKINERFSLA